MNRYLPGSADLESKTDQNHQVDNDRLCVDHQPEYLLSENPYQIRIGCQGYQKIN